jgi:hypothetical protein
MGDVSARTLLAWVAVALGGVVGLSVLVGYAGPKPGFQWELASIFGTALGTTLLAAATGALAYSTKRDRDERERPVVLQQAAVYEGGGVQGGPQQGWLNVSLRNVGLGPALRVEVTADYDDEQHKPTIAPNPYIVPAIAPSEAESFRMFVDFATTPPDGVRADGFPLRGTFTDRSQHGSYEIITEWQTSESDPEIRGRTYRQL